MLGRVVTILRSASRSGWKVLKSVPGRLGRTVTLGAVGGVPAVLVGAAVIVAGLTYLGVV